MGKSLTKMNFSCFVNLMVLEGNSLMPTHHNKMVWLKGRLGIL